MKFFQNDLDAVSPIDQSNIDFMEKEIQKVIDKGVLTEDYIRSVIADMPELRMSSENGKFYFGIFTKGTSDKPFVWGGAEKFEDAILKAGQSMVRIYGGMNPKFNRSVINQLNDDMNGVEFAIESEKEVEEHNQVTINHTASVETSTVQ